MATPPVPPRPFDSYYDNSSARRDSAPPVPPLPPNFRIEKESVYGSPPHFEDPLVAPRPHKLQPDLPADMARTLHDQASTSFPQPTVNDYGRGSGLTAPGFAMPPPGPPPNRGVSPLPPPQGSNWSPWAAATSPQPPQAFPSPYGPQSYPASPQYGPRDVTSPFAAMSLGSQTTPSQPQHHHNHRASTASGYGPPPFQQPMAPHGHVHSTTLPAPPITQSPSPTHQVTQPGQNKGSPSLTAPLPTVQGLVAGLSSIQQPDFDPSRKIAWCRDVFMLVNRAEHLQTIAFNPTHATANDVPVGPVRIGDPQLQRLVDTAVPLVLQLSSPNPMPNPIPVYVTEALYLRATCEASGAYPQHIPLNPRTAFRDFEAAARNGYHAAWFKLGRDYENFGDINHAKDCFERGVRHGDERCLYRLGMANLMGQLNLPASAESAVPLLHRAATLASVEVPQPAYVYGLLLLAEFSHISIPPHLFNPYIPAGSNPQSEARKHLERAAYLNFSPAQYKLGHSYEFATPPFPFDALLSVQYYSLASQQGEIEADMALSKWFLCGAEGAFEKDEGLALTFAEKAAKNGLPSAEFAMGYYAEVGVGASKDIEAARRWYTKASEHGNTDAADRLNALSQPAPQSLSRQEHENLAETTLVRKRTQAKMRSDATGSRPPPMPAVHGAKIVENVRKNSTILPPAVNSAAQPYPGSSGTPNVSDYRTSQSPIPSGSAPRPGTSPPRNQGALPPNQGPPGQRPFANAHRYSLADPGSGSLSPRPSQSPGPGPQAQSRPDSVQSQPPKPIQQSVPPLNVRPPMSRPPTKGPQTFAEMGITTAKVEEKDCVIM